MEYQHPRVDVLGVAISAINMGTATDLLRRWMADGHQTYVCITGVHGVMEAQRDPYLREVHNRAGMTTPDGMPMVWASRWAGVDLVDRVYGPDLMLEVCQLAAEMGWKVFFYGGAPGVGEQLAENLSARYLGLKVAGHYSPPYRDLTPEEDAVMVELINSSGADLVWVGLSTPKQERWMADHLGKLDARVMLGVGAAFDIHAGRVKQAPRFVQRAGLEWLFRLLQEPRRLWRRYLRNNPQFVMRILSRPPRRLAE